MMCWAYDAFYQEYSVHTILITNTNNITNNIFIQGQAKYKSIYIYTLPS